MGFFTKKYIEFGTPKEFVITYYLGTPDAVNKVLKQIRIPLHSTLAPGILRNHLI